jgi:excinuclease ABC subunit C
LCNKKIENGCLDFHLGRCAGSCISTFDQQDYLFRLQLAQEVLKKDQKAFVSCIKDKIRLYNKDLSFEKSKRLSYYLDHLDSIFQAIATRFHEDKYKDDIFVAATPTNIQNNKEVGSELATFLYLPSAIKTIDCFDISHFQSSYIVGSCIRFTGGVPEKNKFRRFKIKTLTQQNDYAALHEIVSRRYKQGDDLPDLIVIDGGKGQLNAVQSLYPQTAFIALAKQEETIFSTHIPQGKVLDVKTPAGKILIAIRDYAHHFAVSYHKLRRKKGMLE